jgi:hypothetical protein
LHALRGGCLSALAVGRHRTRCRPRTAYMDVNAGCGLLLDPNAWRSGSLRAGRCAGTLRQHAGRAAAHQRPRAAARAACYVHGTGVGDRAGGGSAGQTQPRRWDAGTRLQKKRGPLSVSHTRVATYSRTSPTLDQAQDTNQRAGGCRQRKNTAAFR